MEWNALWNICWLIPRWSSRYDQWWECKFLSEGIIDQGGGFRDSLSDIAEELCPTSAESSLPLSFFIRAPNQVVFFTKPVITMPFCSKEVQEYYVPSHSTMKGLIIC